MKQVYRLLDESGRAAADYITLVGEAAPLPGEEVRLNHPSGDWRQMRIRPSAVRPLLSKVMEGGIALLETPGVSELRSRVRDTLDLFDGTYLRLLNPHVYKVSISTELRDLKLAFIDRHYRESPLRRT